MKLSALRGKLIDDLGSELAWAVADKSLEELAALAGIAPTTVINDEIDEDTPLADGWGDDLSDWPQRQKQTVKAEREQYQRQRQTDAIKLGSLGGRYRIAAALTTTELKEKNA